MAVDEERVQHLRRAFADDKGRIIAPTIRRAEGRVLTIPMPSQGELLRLSDGELGDILRRFGVQQNWTQLYNNSADYVARMSPRLAAISASTDPTAFWNEVDRLATGESRRHLLGAARRAQENYTTQRILAGVGFNQQFIRILDSHDNQCEPCIARAGIEGTYQEHADIGLPGEASCDGGSFCRCQLVPID